MERFVSCHMVRPEWDKPIVSISSNRSLSYYSVEVMQEMMLELEGQLRKQSRKAGKNAYWIASNSLSHRHFVTETNPPEDMSKRAHYKPCNASLGYENDRIDESGQITANH